MSSVGPTACRAAVNSSTITLNTVEVVSNGALRVQGDGFPSLTNVKLGALFNETDIQWLADAKTGDTGAFNLLESLTSLENVTLVMTPDRSQRGAGTNRARELLDMLGLT